MAVTVGVEVEDQDGNPIDDMSVEVFDSVGTFLISGTTGDTAPGRVEFSLTGSETGVVYNLRVFETLLESLYSPVTTFVSRKSILVYEPAIVSLPNDAIFTRDVELQDATSPVMCRITGKFVTHGLLPLPGYVFYVRTRQIPRTVYLPENGLKGVMLGGDRVTLRTGVDGKVIFDLPRNGIYNVMLPDYAEEEIIIEVPDASSWDLSELLVLRPYSVTYDDTSPAVAIDAEVEVEVTSFLLSNGRSRDIFDNDYSPSEFMDPTITAGTGVVEVTWKEGTDDVLLIRGLTAGSATIQLVVKDPPDALVPVRLPKAPVIQTALSVTVS